MKLEWQSDGSYPYTARSEKNGLIIGFYIRPLDPPQKGYYLWYQMARSGANGSYLGSYSETKPFASLKDAKAQAERVFNRYYSLIGKLLVK